jgi:hypothetical protein
LCPSELVSESKDVFDLFKLDFTECNSAHSGLKNLNFKNKMKLPKTEISKYIIVYSDKYTGIIMNKDGSFYKNAGEDFYKIFDDINTAKENALKEISLNNRFEIILYDGAGKFIEIMR